VYYLGCDLDEALTARLMETVMDEQGLACTPSPDGVEVAVRGGGAQKIRIVMNHNDVPVHAGGFDLAPFACRIEVL